MLLNRFMFVMTMVIVSATLAVADTIVLSNGVSVDGTITERPDGTLLVQAGDQRVIYRKSEISSIEKNNKTGKVDLTEAKARWAERDAELTRTTGLNAEQRRQVRSIMSQLQLSDPAQRKILRDKLVALQAQMDVYRYLDLQLPELSHRLSPWVLEAMFFIDPARIQNVLRRNTQHTYFGTRAKAIELLGRLRDVTSTDLVVRGLADHQPEVQIMAIYALANMGAREATPALIEFLKNPDMRLANAAREALEAIWKTKLSDPKPDTVETWNAFWNANAASVGAPLQLAALQPLINPEEEYQDE